MLCMYARTYVCFDCIVLLSLRVYVDGCLGVCWTVCVYVSTYACVCVFELSECCVVFPAQDMIADWVNPEGALELAVGFKVWLPERCIFVTHQ